VVNAQRNVLPRLSYNLSNTTNDLERETLVVFFCEKFLEPICLETYKWKCIAKNLEFDIIMICNRTYFRKKRMEERLSQMDRPITTLFMLMSLDGKINSGGSDELDVDRDWPLVEGVREGIHQYYEIEATTDLYSFNSGRVMEKIGVNERTFDKEKMGVSFVIMDRKPHLKESGVEYLAKWVKTLYIITDNENHPAFQLKNQYDNISMLYYEKGIDLHNMFVDLKDVYGIDRITIQSGGTLNGEFLRADLIDYVNVVVAPILVGGSNTNTLIDGKTLMKREELNQLKAMKLLECETLEDSYLRLKYEVLNNQEMI